MSRFKNRRSILIVNIASECDKTKENVEGLNRMWDEYHDRGLEILGFPCNQFKSQEPGSDEEIRKRWRDSFKIKFPLFSKV